MSPIEACPFLPEPGQWLTAATMAVWRADRGAGFYEAALCCAQALWQQGKPAQAILQLNRAWSADLGGAEPVLAAWPPPYRALSWMLGRAPEACYLGNPVRHFQHLATRMHEVRREPRVWRAWACFHLAEGILPAGRFPRDQRQIETEGVVPPSPGQVLAGLDRHGWKEEAACWKQACDGV